MSSGARSDEGIAVVLALVVVLLLAALAFATVMTTDVERMSAASEPNRLAVAYAADAALERAIQELQAPPDWTSALGGGVTSALREGGATMWGQSIDVTAMTSELQAETDAAEARGADTTRWQLFLSGTLSAMVPGRPREVLPYLVAWVGDDLAESDGNPMVDSNRTIRVHARAVGPRDTRADREAVLRRDEDGGVGRVVEWRP
jgi:Tfp pilus assembly protein PilX